MLLPDITADVEKVYTQNKDTQNSTSHTINEPQTSYPVTCISDPSQDPLLCMETDSIILCFIPESSKVIAPIPN